MPKIEPEKFEIRVMNEDDLKAIVDIDERVSGERREEYYERKMGIIMDDKGQIGTSLVAIYDKQVIGFVMGNILTGEFGIPGTTASLDTIGIEPEFANIGVGTLLMEEFITNVDAAGVTNVQTLVDWNDVRLLRFFNRCGFEPSRTLNLEKRI
jgi:ribosomal protein S18 acetylase RimI-like enzyme